MKKKKQAIIKVPLCKRCTRDLMAMSAAGEYICDRCGYIGEPVWVANNEDDAKCKDGSR